MGLRRGLWAILKRRCQSLGLRTVPFFLRSMPLKRHVLKNKQHTQAKKSYWANIPVWPGASGGCFPGAGVSSLTHSARALRTHGFIKERAERAVYIP